MKFLSLLVPLAVLAGIAVVLLQGRLQPSGTQTAVPAREFDEFVQKVGIDISTSGFGLRREAIMSGRQTSLDFCALPPVQPGAESSPLNAFVQGVAVDPANLRPTGLECVSQDPRQETAS